MSFAVFDVELYELRDMPVEVIVKYSKWSEVYGADLDGNRGELRDFVEIESFKILDLKQNDITSKIRQRHFGVFKDVKNDIEKRLFKEE